MGMPRAELLDAGEPAELLRQLDVMDGVVAVGARLSLRAWPGCAGVGDEQPAGPGADAEEEPAGLDEIADRRDIGHDRLERPVREHDLEVRRLVRV